MSDIKYNSYSVKGVSTLGTGLGYGVNEMAETALSMGLQSQRRVLVEGLTSDIDSPFLNDIVQDGLGAGLGFFTGQAMRAQEELLEFAYNRGAILVGTWYTSSIVKNQFKKFYKGRKAGMFSKFLQGSDKKAEEARLIADFVKLDTDTSANSHNPMARQEQHKGKYMHESLEVKKEDVRSKLAKLQIDGMRDTFEMKIKTSSFFVTDKSLIKNMTGMLEVTSKDIDKLNALSNSQVFEDSEGNWIGGNQAMVEMMNGLRLHRV